MSKERIPRIPTATYRLQMNRNFTFKHALGILDYLKGLGISDVYLSPIFKARSGSLHGYDGVDYGEINRELGTRREFLSLVSGLKRRKMGLLMDIVPNHMGTGEENAAWMSVLEHGRNSAYASFFDINWSKKGNPPDKIFLPILGERWVETLSLGKALVTFNNQTGEFNLELYGKMRFPLNPESYLKLLDFISETKRKKAERPILDLKNSLRESYLKDTRLKRPSYRIGAALKRKLKKACASNRNLGFIIKSALKGLPSQAIDQLLKGQFYALGHWRDDSAKINYRRFFEVNDLAAVRVENPKIFSWVHKLALRLLASSKATGVRVDHPDGLRDPTEYFARLQRGYSALTKSKKQNDRGLGRPLYVLAEKILMEGEPLNRRWKVCGTTGYDFANDLNQLLVFPNPESFDSIYEKFTRESATFEERVYIGKRTVLRTLLSSELNSLSDILSLIASKNAKYMGLGYDEISNGLAEIISRFPVYRTYVRDETSKLTRTDNEYIHQALKSSNGVDRRALRLIRSILMLERLEGTSLATQRNFILRFQQLTGPAMAKGVEDTAFYTYNRLSSLNEVGGNPGRFGISTDGFHSRSIARLKNWPHTMLTSSTHDTKRSEDVRARISVLSEIPKMWRSSLNRWSKLNADKKRVSKKKRAPGRNDEYLLYQTLLGAWPLDFNGDLSYEEFVNRIVFYMRKASKEAKENTSWMHPNLEYDACLENFVRKILKRESSNVFLRELQIFARKISYFGMLNSLSSVLLKLT
ncbi:MAG TPA: malto-oligosyltrehalose synthase, partial [Nitrososphaerales archaeon]|nr:malto-oligosyltrehalose synthase [Nitrososphaerales archaeon]